jgi:putative ATP-dependent endonuclease of OLD family
MYSAFFADRGIQMQLSRIVIKNYRSLKLVDVAVKERASCVIGENNTGKSNLIQALRLCLDVTLSSMFRSLVKDDVHCDVDQSQPFQVLVGVEFTNFAGRDQEEAMLHGTQIANDRARIFYRFRPKRPVREAIALGARAPNSLTIADYGWELVGGGNPAMDMTAIEWNTENDQLGATQVNMQYLQSYLIVYLHPLRDVENDLQQFRRSPLARLIEASNIGVPEQEALVAAIQQANATIEASPTVEAVSTSIDTAFKEITGPAFSLGVDLGLSAPTFQSIVRNMNILLSSDAVARFEPRRNGLGLNNILYIAILIEHFRKRQALGRSAGELILIEEPEAHLHPQLQLTLLDALIGLPFQSIVTTHSTQITSKAKLPSYILLTNKGETSPFAAALSANDELDANDVADLERYLDATKSSLLFARRVMLVEGAAELFLLPSLIERVMGVNLEREGISIIAIHGVHFGAFARLFNENCLPKKCAIVADADRDVEAEDEDDAPAESNLNDLENDYVKVFLGDTTFERELVLEGTLPMLTSAARDLGAPRLVQRLEAAAEGEIRDDLRDRVLRTAKRFGKARFAQVAARHSDSVTELPEYIAQAVDWLLDR